ncbi:MAG: chemotaxis protein CheB [Luteolibacter sp.]|uniref:chemotaxis protein CheB n=1 Tax=Luteolibacter sp. TaxID=1962973 RepID=UPI003267F4C0
MTHQPEEPQNASDQQHRTLDAPAAEIVSPDHDVIAEDPLAPNERLVPVVGLGGSAGSLEALQVFFSKIEGATGSAYVVVVHLSPEHESAMAKILQRSTFMPVMEVKDVVQIQPDHVYVIPPGKHFSMVDGLLQATDMIRAKGRHVTVDLFFRTLADTHGVKATAIVLSGGDGDGAMGLKRVKERGGLTICQDPSEAGQTGMPTSAIATGMVDWVLPVAEMPARLAKYKESGSLLVLPDEGPADEVIPEQKAGAQDEAALRDVLAFLNARAGHDFSYYKRATILRRIGRRMQVNGTPTLDDYLAFLRVHPGETAALLQDLLISVTNFFRDKTGFAAVEEIVPELFRGKTSSEQVRVWVPACATGEEAYSFAILLHEYAATLRNPPHIQVFASDLDQEAINIAREGRYPSTIVTDVSDDRLKEFFTKDNGGYRVRRAIRESILFAHHDLLKDSPFSRLDLVSCRNLLIYLNRNAQAKAFDIFHFALRPSGYLFLGSSESAEDASNLFIQKDKRNRVYTRRTTHRIGLSVPTGAATLSFAYKNRLKGNGTNSDLQQVASADKDPAAPAVARESLSTLHQKLIEAAAPPSVVITREYDVVHISDEATEFLQINGGETSVNILRMIHPDLRTELRAALFRISKSASSVTVQSIPMDIQGSRRWVDITVHYQEQVASELYLVSFRTRSRPHDDAERDGEEPAVMRSKDVETIRHLEEEVDQMRAEWKETVEQYEASAEELKASNEELQAMNEELRSATEELETGREELQSINEEIITINHELKSKVEELGRANSDLQNLMASTKIATVFLNRKLQINRYTPSSTGLFNFIPSDVGRPLSDLTHRLEYPEITADAELVLEHLSPVEREVRDTDGNWFLARILPYRTTEDQIAGVVITCVDITERKQAEKEREWLSAAVESSNDAIISFNMEGDIVSWNRGSKRIFGYTADEIKGHPQALLAPPEKQEESRQMLEQLRRGHSIDQFDTVRVCKGGQLIDVSLSVSLMNDESGQTVGATAIAQDITSRKLAVEQLRQARDELEVRVKERTSELAERVNQLAQMASELTSTEQRERKRLAQVLHDQLQQLLVAAKLRLEARYLKGGEDLHDDTGSLVALIDEALANSRSLAIELSPPVLCEGLGKALEWLCGIWMADKYQLKVECEIESGIEARTSELRDLVFLAVKELLFNVVKHAGILEATVQLSGFLPDQFQVIVSDHGLGFDSEECNHQGTGLSSLRERLKHLGGSFEFQGTPGQGVRAVIRAPRV